MRENHKHESCIVYRVIILLLKEFRFIKIQLKDTHAVNLHS